MDAPKFSLADYLRIQGFGKTQNTGRLSRPADYSMTLQGYPKRKRCIGFLNCAQLLQYDIVPVAQGSEPPSKKSRVLCHGSIAKPKLSRNKNHTAAKNKSIFI
jgi:hypothetical protein